MNVKSAIQRNVMLRRVINRINSWIGSPAETPENKVWAAFHRHGITPRNASIDLTGGQITLHDIDLEMPLKAFEPFASRYSMLRRLSQHGGFTYRYDADRGIHASGQDCAFWMQFNEQAYIADEIFSAGVYNVQLNGPIVVIDIGMNVGIASLYFARNPNVQAVYGYEPFPETFREAVVNFDMNSFSNKIHPRNFGLGKNASRERWRYSFERKAQVGKHWIGNINDSSVDGQITEVEVEIRSVVEELRPIMERHMDASVVMKIDCEGAEYEIIDALNASGLLDKAEAYLVEWHRLGPNSISEILKSHGYITLAQETAGEGVGMIYGFRRRS